MNDSHIAAATELTLKERLVALQERLVNLETDTRLTGETRASLAWHTGRARQLTQGLMARLDVGGIGAEALAAVAEAIAEAEGCARSGAAVRRTGDRA